MRNRQASEYELIHEASDASLARVVRLDGWWQKGQGVIGMTTLKPGAGLWLPRVASVHTLFVRFPLDLLFLDSEFRTLRVIPAFPSWRPLAMVRGAAHTLELGAGTFQKLQHPVQIGDTWRLRLVS